MPSDRDDRELAAALNDALSGCRVALCVGPGGPVGEIIAVSSSGTQAWVTWCIRPVSSELLRIQKRGPWHGRLVAEVVRDIRLNLALRKRPDTKDLRAEELARNRRGERVPASGRFVRRGGLPGLGHR